MCAVHCKAASSRLYGVLTQPHTAAERTFWRKCQAKTQQCPRALLMPKVWMIVPLRVDEPTADPLVRHFGHSLNPHLELLRNQLERVILIRHKWAFSTTPILSHHVKLF